MSKYALDDTLTDGGLYDEEQLDAIKTSAYLAWLALNETDEAMMQVYLQKFTDASKRPCTDITKVERHLDELDKLWLKFKATCPLHHKAMLPAVLQNTNASLPDSRSLPSIISK